MLLGKLELNESSTLSFGMNVFGTTENPSDVRFVIENEKFDIVCRCKQIGEDIEVDIPQLKGILEAKEYTVRLEVVIGDKIFVPLKESVEFNQLVEFGVIKKGLGSKPEPTITVTPKIEEEIKVEAKVPTIEEQIAKVSDRYTVKEMNGFNVLIKEGQYWGFVSPTSILEAEQGYASINLLIDGLKAKK